MAYVLARRIGAVRNRWCLLAALLAAVAHAGVAQGAQTTVLRPAADTWADESFPTRSYGGESVLRIDGLPVRESYVRFDGLPAGDVQGAVLRLHATQSHSAGFDVHAASDAWDEQSVTWESRPTVTPEVLAASGPLAEGAWVELDVTAHVRNGGASFALRTGTEESAYVASRDGAPELAPQLVLTTADAEVPPPDDGQEVPPPDGGEAPPPEPDPVSCAGYPEPRVFLESQSWWYDSRALTDGQSSHAHAGACFPLNRSLSGTVRLDVRSLIHNEPAGTRLEFVRIQAMQQGAGVTNLAILNPKLACESRDCTFWHQVDVDVSPLPRSGLTEFRIHTETERPDGSRQRATGGWFAWVENPAPRSTSTAVRWPNTEGRGWYQKPGEPELGYENAVLRSAIPTAPVCGLWNVKLETKAGSGGRTPTGTRVLLDPNLHAVPEDPGTVLHESDGPALTRLTINTALLADGPHKLVIVAKSDENTDERVAGAQVIPFVVDNGLECARPAVEPMFPEGAKLSGDPSQSADVLLDAFADGATRMDFLIDGRHVASDTSAPDFDEYLDVDSVPAGHHELVVRATVDGQVRESAPRGFCVLR